MILVCLKLQGFMSDPVVAGDCRDVRKDAGVEGDNETRKDSSVLEFYY